jgi:hypothetical protein
VEGTRSLPRPASWQILRVEDRAATPQRQHQRHHQRRITKRRRQRGDEHRSAGPGCRASLGCHASGCYCARRRAAWVEVAVIDRDENVRAKLVDKTLRQAREMGDPK